MVRATLPASDHVETVLAQLFGELRPDSSSFLKVGLFPRKQQMTQSFAALPSRRNIRLLIPLCHRGDAERGLHLYTPYSSRARVVKRLFGFSLRAGFVLGADKLLADITDSLRIDSMIRELTGHRAASYALYFSTSNSYPKLTIEVRNRDTILGYIKVPLTEDSSARVRHEAEILTCLQALRSLRCRVPRNLGSGVWNSRYLVFQSPMPGRPGPADFGRAHKDFLQTLSAEFATSASLGGIAEKVAAHWADVAPHFSSWDELATTVFRLAGSVSGAAVVCGLRHGDFAAWNTLVCSGELAVFDWEAACWGQPLMWDEAHFRVQGVSLLGRSQKGAIRELTGGDSVRAVLAMLYVLQSSADLLLEGVPGFSPAFKRRRQVLQQLVNNFIK